MSKNYAWPVTIAGRYDYNALERFIKQYKNIIDKKKIVIFGAGIRGTLFSIWLKEKGYSRIIFTDNNEEKVGNYINEFQIESFEEVCRSKDENFILVAVENANGIKKQLIQAGFHEGIEFAEAKSEVYDNYLAEFLRKDSIDTMVIGDCGISDVGLHDTNYESLDELLKERFGKSQTKVLAMHGMGMRAFYQIIKAHCKAISKPKQLIVMANFETFTGKQHLLPRSQHTDLIQLLCEHTLDKELEEYLAVTKERYNLWQTDYFTSSNEGANRGSQNDRIVLKMNYMYHLSLDNECIQYMFLLQKFCMEQHIKLCFFIPPANYQYAEKLWGIKFKERYEENLKVLKQALDERKIQVLDLSYLLKSNEFAAECTIDECANYQGRVKVADAIKTFVSEPTKYNG